MKKIGQLILIGLISLNFVLGSGIIGCRNQAYAQEQALVDIKEDYTEICTRTQNAMGLSAEELRDHIDRCDKLQLRIDKLTGPQAETERKVYTKRLKMCRDLYQFALEYKEHKK